MISSKDRTLLRFLSQDIQFTPTCRLPVLGFQTRPDLLTNIWNEINNKFIWCNFILKNTWHPVSIFLQYRVSIDGKLAEVMRHLPKFFIKQRTLLIYWWLSDNVRNLHNHMHKWLTVTACVVSIAIGVCACVKESFWQGAGKALWRRSPLREFWRMERNSLKSKKSVGRWFSW